MNKVGFGFRVIQLRNSDWRLRNFNQPRAHTDSHKQAKNRYKIQGLGYKVILRLHIKARLK